MTTSCVDGQHSYSLVDYGPSYLLGAEEVDEGLVSPDGKGNLLGRVGLDRLSRAREDGEGQEGDTEEKLHCHEILWSVLLMVFGLDLKCPEISEDDRRRSCCCWC